MTAPEPVVRAVRELRPLPQVARDVLDTIADDDSSLDALIAAVRSDADLNCRVLRLIEKSGHHLPAGADDLSQILAYFGIRNLTRVIVVQCLSASYRGVVGEDANMAEFWHHSVASAIAAEVLAERTGLVSPGAAFAAGLLHNIGRPLLERLYDLRGDAVLHALDSNDSFHQIEEALTGTHHGIAGLMIARRWRLPSRLTKVIRFFHEASGTVKCELCAVAHVAHLMVLQMGLGMGIEGLQHTTSMSALAQLQLSVQDLDLLRAELVTELKRAEYLNRHLACTA